MLYKYLLPILRQIDVTLGNPAFQQDNARIHTSNIMQRFFTRYNIDVADHLPVPCSPDLNPIEHTWVLLKLQVMENYPDLADTPGGVDTVKTRLAEVLPLWWGKLPETQFEIL